MAQRIILKNSNGVDKDPISTDLALGELAVNTVTGALYTLKSDNSVQEIGNVDSEIGDLDNTKADKTTQVLSNTSYLSVTDPTLADDVTLDLKVGVNNGLCPLNAAGVVDPSYLPTTKVNFLGSWDAANGTPPIQVRGSFYNISGTGTIDVSEIDGGATTPTEVNPGDQIISDGVSWVVLFGSADVLALGVEFDNFSTQIITGDNAQVALEQLDTQVKTNLDDMQAHLTNQLVSNSTDMLTVTDPTFADDISLTVVSNTPNGVVQLDGAGQIPISVLPQQDLEIIGSFDASLSVLPADANTRGQYYVIESGGTLQLTKTEPAVLEPVVVSVGDSIVFLSAGNWLYRSGTAATTASAVTFDPTNTQMILSSDVQNALLDLDGSVGANDGKIDGLRNDKIDKVVTAMANNVPVFDATGALTDSMVSTSDFATAAQGTLADNALSRTETIDGGTY